MPPLAVPSSLVNTIPVMSTTSANTLAWLSPFCPVVASRTSSTSPTAASFSMTRLTLPSSSIRPTLFCSRPAVSTITTSTSCSIPVFTASKATDAGSAPSTSDLIVGTPTRAPQVASCSAAAARNVSAAPSRTSLSSATSTRASLPTVVVLPTPLTPTTRTIAGSSPCRETASDRSIPGSTNFTSSSRNIARTSSGFRLPMILTRSRRISTSSRLGSVPMSANSRVSSISSQTASSILSLASSASSPLPRALFDFESLARKRCKRPAAGSGCSRTGVSPPGRTTRPSSGTSSTTGRSARSTAPPASAPGAAPGAGSLASRGPE